MSRAPMTREMAAELLAFEANGTLSETESAELAIWLGRDVALRDELDQAKKLRMTLRVDPLPQSPGEFGLARLMRDVSNEAPQAVAPKTAPQTAAPERSRLWDLALAASVAALATATVTTLALRAPTEAPVYEQASGDGDMPVLTVTFRPEASLGDLAAFLQEHDLIIVDGPGAMGLYRLAPPPGSDTEALAQTLRAADHLVLSVDDQE